MLPIHAVFETCTEVRFLGEISEAANRAATLCCTGAALLRPKSPRRQPNHAVIFLIY